MRQLPFRLMFGQEPTSLKYIMLGFLPDLATISTSE